MSQDHVSSQQNADDDVPWVRPAIPDDLAFIGRLLAASDLRLRRQLGTDSGR